MAAGALGSVSNRLRHENGDTHVGDCDDVFSDAGSTPAASTKKMPGLCPGYFFVWRRRSSVAQAQTSSALSSTNFAATTSKAKVAQLSRSQVLIQSGLRFVTPLETF